MVPVVAVVNILCFKTASWPSNAMKRIVSMISMPPFSFISSSDRAHNYTAGPLGPEEPHCRPVGPEEPAGDLATGGLRRPGIHNAGPFGPEETTAGPFGPEATHVGSFRPDEERRTHR